MASQRLGAKLCPTPSNSYVEALTPDISEYDYLEIRPLDKMKPLEWALIQS